MVKNRPDSAGDMGSIPGLGTSHMPRSNGAHSQLLSLCCRAQESNYSRLQALSAWALQQEKPPQ